MLEKRTGVGPPGRRLSDHHPCKMGLCSVPYLHVGGSQVFFVLSKSNN